MPKSSDTVTIAPHKIAETRDGEPLPEPLGKFIIAALDGAVEQVNTQSGPSPRQLSVGEIRDRIKIADEVSAVQEGETLTISASSFATIERCIVSHYVPTISSVLLRAMPEKEDKEE